MIFAPADFLVRRSSLLNDFAQRMLFVMSLICALVTFSFALPCSAGPSAQAAADINALISKIEAQKDLRFIRNGKEYSPSNAAEFLRRKWKEKCTQAESVEQFIDICATKSNTSGQPYQVKSGGQLRPAAEWLRELAAH